MHPICAIAFYKISIILIHISYFDKAICKLLYVYLHNFLVFNRRRTRFDAGETKYTFLFRSIGHVSIISHSYKSRNALYK